MAKESDSMSSAGDQEAEEEIRQYHQAQREAAEREAAEREEYERAEAQREELERIEYDRREVERRKAVQTAKRQEAARTSQPIEEVLTRELVLGMLGLVVWFGLFSGGILIGTEPYLAALQNPGGLVIAMQSWFMVCSFWTITNIGLLACVASFLGAFGRRTRFTLQFHSALAEKDGSGADLHLATYYVSAIMRGFGVYALVLAGLLVLATESLTTPTQAYYMRLAPTVSIISFYAGFDPNMFKGLLERVNSFLQTNGKQGV